MMTCEALYFKQKTWFPIASALCWDGNYYMVNSHLMNLTNSEGTNSNGLTAFGTDGFTVGTEARVNSNGLSFVSWQSLPR